MTLTQVAATRLNSHSQEVGSVSSIDSRESLIGHLTDQDIDMVDILKPLKEGRFNVGVDNFVKEVIFNMCRNKIKCSIKRHIFNSFGAQDKIT